MTWKEIRQRFINAGWRVTTPPSRHLLVGYSEDFVIWTFKCLDEIEEPSFELVDSRRSVSCWVRVVPTPRIAAVLLEEHGEPLEVNRNNHYSKRAGLPCWWPPTTAA